MPRSSKAMTKLEQATTAYLKNLEATGASPTTIANYSIRLNVFIQFLWDNDYTLEDPKFSTIQAWRDSLIADGKKLSTVSQYLMELRMFFRWASDPEMGDCRYYESNPCAKSLLPKLTAALKRPYDTILTDEQVMKLWNSAPVKSNGRTPSRWARNYAMTVVFLTTDIRNQELIDLTPDDLDFENAEITIQHGKGNKYRVVPFPPLAQTAVKLYLASGYRPDDVPSNECLFGSHGSSKCVCHWRKLQRQSLYYIIRDHVECVTGVPNVGTHDLRHVGARIDLNSGISLEELQAKLGHESMNTTQLYSGKLLPKRGRNSAKRVIEEQEIQARRNAEKLERMGVR